MTRKIFIFILLVLLLSAFGLLFFAYKKDKIAYLYNPYEDRMIFSIKDQGKDFFQYKLPGSSLEYKIYRKSDEAYEVVDVDNYPSYDSGFYPDYCLYDPCKSYKIPEQPMLDVISQQCQEIHNDELFFTWDLKEDVYLPSECNNDAGICYEGRKRVEPGSYMLEVCFSKKCQEKGIHEDYINDKCYSKAFLVPDLPAKPRFASNEKYEKLLSCRDIYLGKHNEASYLGADKVDCGCEFGTCVCDLPGDRFYQDLLIYNHDLDTCLNLNHTLVNSSFYSVDVYNLKASDSVYDLISYGEFYEDSKDFDENCNEVYMHYTNNLEGVEMSGCNNLELREKMKVELSELGFYIDEDLIPGYPSFTSSTTLETRKVSRDSVRNSVLFDGELSGEDKSKNRPEDSWGHALFGGVEGTDFVAKKTAPENKDDNIYYNEKYDLTVTYPYYLNDVFKRESNSFVASSDHGDVLSIVVIDGSLDDYVYVNDIDSLQYIYNTERDIWEPNRVDVSGDLAPRKTYIGNKYLGDLIFYEVDIYDAETAGQMAIVENKDDNYVIELSFTRSLSMESYGDGNTFNRVISKIKF